MRAAVGIWTPPPGSISPKPRGRLRQASTLPDSAERFYIPLRYSGHTSQNPKASYNVSHQFNLIVRRLTTFFLMYQRFLRRLNLNIILILTRKFEVCSGEWEEGSLRFRCFSLKNPNVRNKHIMRVTYSEASLLQHQNFLPCREGKMLPKFSHTWT